MADIIRKLAFETVCNLCTLPYPAYNPMNTAARLLEEHIETVKSAFIRKEM
jgi:hypothetical protein